MTNPPSAVAARESQFREIVTLVREGRQERFPRRSAKRGCGGLSGFERIKTTRRDESAEEGMAE
jgi:hypothetical protein